MDLLRLSKPLQKVIGVIVLNKVKQFFKFEPFSKKQRMILNWWCDMSPVRSKEGIIADGAIRSGKTLSMSLSYVMWAMDSFSGQNMGMCGKTIGSFRRNVLFWLKLMLKSRGYHVTDRRADNMIVVQRNGTENYFYIFGGKDERSQDLIQGITLAGCFFDEVALMPESFVNQATGRCSVEGSKFWFNCNPDGPYHWFKVNWIDRAKDKRLLYLHFTMEDNLSLAENIKARYRSMYVGVFFKRYILGLWAMAEGVIYDMFSEEDNTKSQAEIEQLNYTGRNYVSVDYGTQNAMVFLLWEETSQGEFICTREYYYSGRDKQVQKTDAEYATDLTKWLGEKNVMSVILDPSAASFKAQLEKDGYKVKKAKNDVADGIRLVATLLNMRKIYFSKDCKNTIQEFASYSWDSKAVDRGEDKPLKQWDHAMDSVRYFCMTVIKIKKGMRVLR
jgi:phage terminase, large subunit, PBSX family